MESGKNLECEKCIEIRTIRIFLKITSLNS